MALSSGDLRAISKIVHFPESSFSLKTIDGSPYIQARAQDVLQNPQGGFYNFNNFCAFKQEGDAEDDSNWIPMPYIYAPGFARGWTCLKEDCENPHQKLLFSSYPLSEDQIEDISCKISKPESLEPLPFESGTSSSDHSQYEIFSQKKYWIQQYKANIPAPGTSLSHDRDTTNWHAIQRQFSELDALPSHDINNKAVQRVQILQKLRAQKEREREKMLAETLERLFGSDSDTDML